MPCRLLGLEPPDVPHNGVALAIAHHLDIRHDLLAEQASGERGVPPFPRIAQGGNRKYGQAGSLKWENPVRKVSSAFTLRNMEANLETRPDSTIVEHFDLVNFENVPTP